MNDREVMRQALDRLEIVALQMLKPQDVKVVQALRTALEQPEQEPVAWTELTQSGQIAYFDGYPVFMPGKLGNASHPDPLYTAPPAAQRKPLTDKTLWEMWVESPSDVLRFARAIEAARGIKGEA